MLAIVDSRYAGMPDVPAIAERLPGWELPPSWFGMLAPAQLPAQIARDMANMARIVKATGIQLND